MSRFLFVTIVDVEILVESFLLLISLLLVGLPLSFAFFVISG